MTDDELRAALEQAYALGWLARASFADAGLTPMPEDFATCCEVQVGLVLVALDLAATAPTWDDSEPGILGGVPTTHTFAVVPPTEPTR